MTSLFINGHCVQCTNVLSLLDKDLVFTGPVSPGHALAIKTKILLVSVLVKLWFIPQILRLVGTKRTAHFQTLHNRQTQTS